MWDMLIEKVVVREGKNEVKQNGAYRHYFWQQESKKVCDFSS